MREGYRIDRKYNIPETMAMMAIPIVDRIHIRPRERSFLARLITAAAGLMVGVGAGADVDSVSIGAFGTALVGAR